MLGASMYLTDSTASGTVSATTNAKSTAPASTAYRVGTSIGKIAPTIHITGTFIRYRLYDKRPNDWDNLFSKKIESIDLVDSKFPTRDPPINI